MSSQKALIVTAIGKPLELSQRPIPEPGSKQIQLRVTVAGLNPHDHKLRDHGLFTDRDPLPAILGNDVAGVVTKLGPGATKFKVGDRVFTYAKLFEPDHVQKGLQEYSVADEDFTAHIPEGFTDNDVATLPVNVDASAIALFNEHKLGIPPPWSEKAKTFDHTGTTILIIGGGSNCGRYGVQLAKMAGIGKIVTLGGSEEELKGWGATHVLNRHGSHAEVQARIRDVVGDELIYCYDAVNPVEGQYVGVNALSSNGKGKFARLIPEGPLPLDNLEKKEGEYWIKDVHGMPQLNDFSGFWDRFEDILKEGKIVPLKYEVVAEGLDADKVNKALDEYRDGKRNVQAHVRISH